MQQTSQLKQSPSGRRQGGRNRGVPQQKAYASENDVPRYKHGRSSHPTTPQKGQGASPSARACSTQKKGQRSSGHPCTKTASALTDQEKPDQESPPPPSKADAAPIFAGSSFHASPAPSALPIPSFLARSDPDSGAKTASSPEQEYSSATTDSGPSSPPFIPRTDESPLEFFFRADRAEKAGTRRASYGQVNRLDLSPLSPPRDLVKECATFPKKTTTTTTTNQARRSNYPKRPAALGISPDELDGNPGRPVGPAFSTPFQERLRAARSNQNSTQTTPVAPPVLRSDPSSEALKRYLTTGRLSHEEQLEPESTPSKPVTRTSPQRHTHPKPHQRQATQHQSPQARLPRGVFPASVLTANAPGSQPSNSEVHAQLTSYRSEQLLMMEDGLRRILKMDVSTPSLTLS
ncbi:hypothetical protein GGS23DRAFT_322507 [Durotheca rogersii]|uniref:uncharacterized protein n=1 Tax=Durotheca rogersii TaxID=419775 RepID=UPI002220572B|nr:uncharacterized protein GGS23DRAFT_322507 [Durotheca rogersii]KAI5859334.1 hypothetical protein GGS23DRAFT_322507 [Durotheca rogersii]